MVDRVNSDQCHGQCEEENVDNNENRGGQNRSVSLNRLASLGPRFAGQPCEQTNAQSRGEKPFGESPHRQAGVPKECNLSGRTGTR